MYKSRKTMYKYHLSSQHPAEDPSDLSWANDQSQSIKSFFSVSKKVKIDTTQQTDPGGGGQAGDEDEGRQDIQEPEQVGGGDPSQDLS